MTGEPHGHRLRKHPLPSIDWLRARFTYDPETGIIWHRPTDLFGARTRADHINSKGYTVVKLRAPTGPLTIRAHRLAFAIMEGRWPHLIDHRNTDRANNRWDNLREAGMQLNAINSPKAARARHIYRVRTTTTAQATMWQIMIGDRRSGTGRKTTRRDFCAAWKVRREWLANRTEYLTNHKGPAEPWTAPAAYPAKSEHSLRGKHHRHPTGRGISRRPPRTGEPTGSWRIMTTARQTTRRDFCAAWRVRRQWLEERAAQLAAEGTG